MGSQQDESQKGLTESKKAALTRTIMHMFMRANIIEACMMRLLELVHAHLRALDPTEDKLKATAELLELDPDEVDVNECGRCLTGPEGAEDYL